MKYNKTTNVCENAVAITLFTNPISPLYHVHGSQCCSKTSTILCTFSRLYFNSVHLSLYSLSMCACHGNCSVLFLFNMSKCKYVSIGLQQFFKPQEFWFKVSILTQTWLILGLNNGCLEYSFKFFFLANGLLFI